MSKATLQVAGVSYPVFVGTDAAIETRLRSLVAGRQVLVVSDQNVAPTHLAPVSESFRAAADVRTLILPPGERTKSLEFFRAIIDDLAVAAYHRDAMLVALGGGVINDLGGFAAACYQRGIRWLAVPTTLLAQVDASLGGKTAINHPAAKNLIGAFHDPVAVWVQPERLATLPEREYRAGLAEVVKYGLGFDADFFAWLEEHASQLLARDAAVLFEALISSIRLKLEVVAADPNEHGDRALLNLGHTLGHAIETALGHGTWAHGEAVAVGLMAAAELSAARARLDPEAPRRLRALLHRFCLPTALPAEANDAALAEALALDKKIAEGRLRFVGLQGIGRAAVWRDVGVPELRRAIVGVRRSG